MKEATKLENTRFQVKQIVEFAPVKSNVKYAQMRELEPVRSNVKYAQVANF